MYHLAPLTQEQVWRGVPFQISNILTETFFDSANDALERKVRGAKVQSLEVFVESRGDDGFEERFGKEFFLVYYLPKEALDLLRESGLHLPVIETVSGLHRNVRRFQSFQFLKA